MAIEFHVELQPVAGQDAPADGWRGLADFGELWSADDTAFWPAWRGELPLGEPLVYSVRIRNPVPSGDPPSALLLLPAVDERRRTMADGAQFTLRDGATVRATGRIISASPP